MLGAVNFLANRYDKSYDSTHNKQFSLSDQTMKVAKGLNTDINVLYFGETGSFLARTIARPLLRALAQDPRAIYRSRAQAAAGARRRLPQRFAGDRRERRQAANRPRA